MTFSKLRPDTQSTTGTNTPLPDKSRAPSALKVSVAVNGRYHAFQLASELNKAGHLHQLISTCLPRWSRRYGIDADDYTTVMWLEALKQAWRRLPPSITARKNPKLWFNERFDEQSEKLISPEATLFVGWAGSCLRSLKMAQRQGLPTVVDRGSSHMDHHYRILREEHDIWGVEFDKIHPGVRQRQLEEYDQADYIVIPSTFVRKTFTDAGIADSKLIQIPYGVSLKDFYPVPKEDDVFRIIYCGRLELQKGVQYLIQAFHELDLPNAELCLIGRCRPEFKPVLDRYPSDKIVLKGFQPHSLLNWSYSQGSIFCLPSVQDGFGMVIAQAMACGLPVIHSTNTGGADIVRPGLDGFSVPIRDTQALKDRILFFYENPDKRTQMSQNALEEVRECFSWDDYGRAMIEAYQKIVDGS